jgi:ribosomal protein S18 acetylase RimI-like enzyme
MTPTLRPAVAADTPALVDICIRTGHRGGDAREAYTEPGLLAAMYLRPYLQLAPAWCLVLEGGGVPLGYVVGTPDTAAFAAQAERLCWPALRTLHPLPAADDPTLQARLVRVLHAGPITPQPFHARHPAHLHIDLLPEVQGRGHGARLLGTFTAALREAGVCGVHLGVSAHNPRAIAFYRREGFETLVDAGWGLWMGRRLEPPDSSAR